MEKNLDFNEVVSSFGSDDDSSLNVLDLNIMPDAQKSVSFIHVSNKTSSIDSWLDHCFSGNDEEKSNKSDSPLNEDENCSSNKMPYTSKKFEAEIEAGGEDRSLCVFDFNAEELDLDLLINEDEDQNNTITQDNFKECVESHNQELLNSNELFVPNEQSSLQNTCKSSLNQTIDQWSIDKLGDFSGFGCQIDKYNGQTICENEQFGSAGDAENILNKEEEYFEKQNKFKLNENFDISTEDESNKEFSVCRSSNFFDIDEEGGKVSIGTYIRSRSEKLGKLGKDSVAERPSFGLKVVTPNNQKENNLMNISNNSFTKNESVDQSLMVTLSKALSDMSTSLSSDELAEFLIALSKKKNASSALKNFLQEETLEPQAVSLINSEQSTFHSCINKDKDCESIVEKNIPKEYFLSSSQIQSVVSQFQSPESKVCTQNDSKNFSKNITSSAPLNLFLSLKEKSVDNDKTLTDSNSEFTFLPCSENSFCSNVLSSTKDNFSFLNGSMGRESIVKYHQNLRAHVDEKEKVMLDFVTAPSELLFENPLCIGVPSKGVMPLKNKTSSSVKIDLRCISISIDGKKPLYPYENYISMKKKLMLSAYGNEDNSLYIIGLEPGKYKIIIEVLSSLIVSDNVKPKCSSSLVQVNAIVQHPSVFIEYELDSHLGQRPSIDFGQVIYGSSKCMPIRLLNKSKFTVPVYLLLSMPGLNNCLFFLALSQNTTHDQEKTVKKLQVVLNPSEEPFVIWLHFNSFCASPSSEHFINQPLDKVQGQLKVLLDAPFNFYKNKYEEPTTKKLLDTVQLDCAIGFCKLHAPKNKQVLTFIARKGASDVKKIPIKNVGNIRVQVKFSFDHYSNLFKLDPECAIIPPKKEMLLTVAFFPNHLPANMLSNTPVTRIILMNILPSGPQFEVQIYGIVMPSLLQNTLPPSKSDASLLTNKTQLQWGGVALGVLKKQKLLLRSISTNLPIQCRCSITGVDSSCFNLNAQCWSIEKLVQNKDITVLPNQDQSVFVVFTPNEQKLFRAKLEIKTPIDNLQATKYTIPLIGYGGTSQIAIENISKAAIDSKSLSSHSDYRPECYLTNVEGTSTEIALTNNGCRSAFVKLIAYEDGDFKQVVTSVIFYPSRFILKSQQSKVVMVKFNSTIVKPVFICILHGDEFALLLMRKALNLQSSTSSLLDRYISQSQSHIRSISFTDVFAGEGFFTEESIEENDVNLLNIQMFYHNLRQTLIEFRNKEVASATSNNNSITNLSVFDIPVRDVEPIAKQQECLLSIDKPNTSSFSHNWFLSPQCVSLDVLSTTDATKMNLPNPVHVKIKNQSLATLFFDVVWPGHYLTVTPQHGLVEAEAAVLLLINANSSLSATASLLPWCGQILILVTDNEMNRDSRNIFVQIKKNSSQPQSLNRNKPNTEADNLFSKGLPEAKPKIKTLNNFLDFAAISVGSSSKLKLEFQNVSTNSIKWVLTSVAPSYVKSHCYNDPANVYRCSYAPFVFSCKSGHLRSNEWARVEVTFNPMSIGTHSQLWEIEYHDENDAAAVTLERLKISLKGEVENSASNSNSACAEKLTLPKSDVYVSEDCYWFPDTAITKTSLIKIPVKNRGKSAETVKFVHPRPPFYMTQQKYTVRSMSCANLPVTFKPIKSGFHSDVLTIESSCGSITLTLKANAFQK